jgi:CheY-like chemotaxis protein
MNGVSSLERAAIKPGNLILVVDDEPDIRGIIKTFLERGGYEVITASDGESGQAMFLQHRDRIRLVLTDTQMPGMHGVAMVQAIRQLDQSVPVIAASGNPDPAKFAEFEALNVTTFLPKPYLPAQLLSTVEAVLQGEAAAPR